ncbi:MFS transporter [Microbacterium sp. X-17]|uniref:MFS transporter n=1 Tax=Microbacterium sp. X-17 TaxID=3144404 RepID=UPI0031F55DD6
MTEESISASDSTAASREAGALADAAPGADAAPLTPGQRRLRYWVVVGVAALTVLDLSKMNVALPAIQAGVQAGPTELQLIIAGYILTFGLVLVPAGRLGDQRSRRTLLLVGLTLFLIASIGCALAPNAGFLFAARVVQGMAAGLQMPQVIGLIQQLFRGEARGRAFGLFGATIGVATAIAPTIGGLLMVIGGGADAWRVIFWVNVPICLTGIILVARFFPRSRPASKSRVDLDILGVVLLGLTVVCLMIPFLFTTGGPQDDPNRWWFLAGSAVFLFCFLAWERRYESRGRTPLIRLGMFAVGSFRNGVLVASAFLAAMNATLVLTLIYLQVGVGLVPVQAALVVAGFALSEALASWFGGTLVARYGRTLVITGLTSMLGIMAALVLVAWLSAPDVLPWAMAIVLTIGGLASGIILAPNQTLMLSEVPITEASLAGSIGQLGQRIGTAIGAAMVLASFYAIASTPGGGTDSHQALGGYAAGMAGAAAITGLGVVAAAFDIAGQRRARRAAARSRP